MSTDAGQPVRTADHRIRLDDGGMATVRATISWPYWREADVWIESISTDHGEAVEFKALRAGARRRMIRNVLRATMVSVALGDTTCRHGRYLIEEFCIPCVAEGRATP